MILDPELTELLTRTLAEPPLNIEPMAGATSSDLYLLTLAERKIVLRIFKEERWETSAASLSERESAILSALTDSGLSTPVSIGTLPGNGVLMSWLPGSVLLPDSPESHWLEELARGLGEIHRLQLSVPYRYESWNDVRGHPAPDWWQDGELWAAAQRLALAEPAYEPRLIHRDYHPVNVLWEGAGISGIVDWINACMGPAGVDVAHCRLNLALMYGPATADTFLSAYEAGNPGYQHDCYWDIDDALGALPDLEPYPPWAEFGLTGLTRNMLRARFQAFVRSALSGLPAK